MRRLSVSENGRFLVQEGGRPFFFLGDTAWELFHRLNREEADHYLQDRARKRFTVVQAVALAEFGGLTAPNPYGELPLRDLDPARPNDAYFQHVDWVVERANRLGLVVGLLPTWGDKVNKKWGQGPEIFTPENARPYGEFLGRRCRNRDIIWILGGDRPIESPRQLEVWRAMADGLRAGDGGSHLITYHPMGGHSSSEWLHAEPWLSFNMFQSGHSRRDPDNYRMASRDYARAPVKPVVDGEAPYEDHPINWDPKNGWFDERDVRKCAYWSVFAGAHGHTYGCHDVWQFWQPGREPVSSARTPWREAIKLPGASQVQHLRALMESRPFLTRIPDQSLLATGEGTGGRRRQATRDSRGSYAFVYLPEGGPVSLHLDGLRARRLAAWWFDPRTGGAQRIGERKPIESQSFVAPSEGPGNDWALVLDDAEMRYPAPGSRRVS